MKTLFKTMLFLAILLAGFKGYSQCSNPFNAYVQPGGVAIFYNYQTADSLPGYSLVWDFGDGDTSHYGSYGATHTYTASGSYLVCLTTTNSATSCTSTSCDTVVINLCQYSSNYQMSQTGFGDFAFGPGSLQGLTGVTAAWSFGDGATSSAISPTHHYTTSGNYDVCLIISSSTQGCADTTCRNVGVNICNYTSYFSTDSTGQGNSVHSFTVNNPNAGYNYSWNFGDGNFATGDSVGHHYTSSGLFQVCLTTSDQATGCFDSICDYHYFDPCGIGQGNVYVSGNGLDASFTGVVNGTGSYTYSWSFPGGTPPTASGSVTPSTTYSQLGPNIAYFYVTSNGCTDTFTSTFTLAPPSYSISGTVLKNGVPACGWVYLIRQDTTGHLALVQMNQISDSLGSCTGAYSFTGLPVDTYYVKASLGSWDPDSINYLPTYYGDVLTWNTATPIINSSDVNNANINMIAGNNPGGPGFIGGWVSQGAGLAIGGSHYNRATGDPIPNEQINLLTVNDVPVAYTYTDFAGHYQFSNLAYGTYKIYVEELNKMATPEQVTISAANPIDTSANLSVNSTSAVGTGIETLGNLELNRVYPNPVVSELELQISSNRSTDGLLKLIDVMGRVSMEKRIKLSTGENNMVINMSEMAAGVYQLIVQTDSKRVSYKVVKTR